FGTACRSPTEGIFAHEQYAEAAFSHSYGDDHTDRGASGGERGCTQSAIKSGLEWRAGTHSLGIFQTGTSWIGSYRHCSLLRPLDEQMVRKSCRCGIPSEAIPTRYQSCQLGCGNSVGMAATRESRDTAAVVGGDYS